MSGIGGTGAIGDYSLLARLVADSASAKQKLDTLTEQSSSGLVASTYAGLGAGAAVSLNLSPQIASLQVWQGNIDAATGQIGVTLSAMTQLQQVASTFLSDTNDLNGLSTSEIDSIASNARNALSQVTNFLDTQDGSGHYVFGGQDSANPPVPDPSNILGSWFYTQIAAAVGGLSGAGAAATASATLAIASSNAAGTSPFSAYMSQPAVSLQAPIVQTGDGQTTPIGLLASANSFVTSGGGSTTGSYARDLLRGLATIGSLSGAQANDPGFGDLVQDVRTSLTGAVTAMASEAGVLGDKQSALTTTKAQLGDTQTALTGQVSAVQDVDMATTLTNLSAVQTQLQASYQLIAGQSSLSLVKYLPVG